MAKKPKQKEVQTELIPVAESELTSVEGSVDPTTYPVPPDPVVQGEPSTEPPAPEQPKFDVIGTDKTDENPYVTLLDKLSAELDSEANHLAASFAPVTANVGYILVKAKNNIYTFARIVAADEGGFESEFLSHIPAHDHASLTKIFNKIEVKISGRSFIHPSGIL